MMRLLIAGMAATAVTAGLFWGMSLLIAADGQRPPTRPGADLVNFIRVERDSRTEVRQRVKPRLEKAQQPPAAPMPVTAAKAASAPAPQAIAVDTPALALDLQLDTTPTLGEAVMAAPATGGQDVSLVPLVRVPPQYPRRAAMRHIEGWVKVAFTISKTGHVMADSVRVIDAEPAQMFDQAAIAAIARWRFTPHTVNGQPQPREAVQTLEFKL